MAHAAISLRHKFISWRLKMFLNKKALIMLSALAAAGGCNHEYDYNELLCHNDDAECYNQKQEPISGIVKKYGNGGELKEIMNFKNGKRHGHFVLYFDDGKIAEEGNFANGVENGVFKAYYPNGQVNVEVTYLNGLENGKYSEYAEDGKLVKEINYTNGKRNGLTAVYEGGKAVVQANYAADELDGEIKLPNGTAKFSNGVLSAINMDMQGGKYEVAFEDGQPETFKIANDYEQIERVKSDAVDGYFCKVYYKNVLRFESGMQKIKYAGSDKTAFKLYGEAKEYFWEGNLKKQYFLNDCNPEGLYKEYNEDGSLKAQMINEITPLENSQICGINFVIIAEAKRRNTDVEISSLSERCFIELDVEQKIKNTIETYISGEKNA